MICFDIEMLLILGLKANVSQNNTKIVTVQDVMTFLLISDLSIYNIQYVNFK